MAKKQQKIDDQFAVVEETLTKSEQWVEKNQKKLIIVISSIVVLITLYMGYQKIIIDPKNREALAEMFIAEKYFEDESYETALNGDGQYLGFIDIINDYGNTKAGNLANYYAGISYLNLGDNENAIEYLSNFKSKDEIIYSISLGSLGDAYINLNQIEKGISYYQKAAKNSNNKFTSPIYLKKAAIAYENIGKFDEALSNYTKIKDEFNNSEEAADIDKYISRTKLLVK